MGYHRAGFDVVGVDIAPQPNYPFSFVQDDAVSFVRRLGHRFAAVHASPPCQSSSALTKGTNKGREYPDLIPATREVLARLDVPTVIENVQGSDLRRDLTLCGEMFGLGVIRHRYFEIEGFECPQPEHLKHRGRVAGYRHGQWYDGPYFAVYGDGGGKGTLAQWQEAMGVDWMTSKKELAEAIPPAYTHYIGLALAMYLTPHRPPALLEARHGDETPPGPKAPGPVKVPRAAADTAEAGRLGMDVRRPRSGHTAR
ncbi:putative site-specific DNA-cytosine methylase [Mycobacterium phage PP]|uniref:Putative site-specific DNA-cytosine methylase n=1 Tax=Mycobacterium phage PP TaxID=2077134 RepID=A0A2Z5XVJ5_9CAUD|nr:putative site-specific DNA-cytosine methylase [Mycobacterium phage PP]BBC53872.1 putative site-specific DNA-cytosine methylase [Mycobacterium phage PP]